jgi:hypothetical protein
MATPGPATATSTAKATQTKAPPKGTPTQAAPKATPTKAASATPKPAVSVRFSAATYGAVEGEGSVLITVVLSEPAAEPVTVDYASLDGTASAGEDYAAVRGQLVFPAGVTERGFRVPIGEDARPEGAEHFWLKLHHPINAALDVPRIAQVVIADDD